MTSHQYLAQHSAGSAYTSPDSVLPADGFLPAPSGTLRLFRLLNLIPIPEIQLQAFPYRKLTTSPSQSSHHVNGRFEDNGTCPSYDAISYAWNPNTPDPENDRNPITHTSLPMQPILVHTSSSSHPVTLNVTSHLIYGLLTAQELCSPSWLFVDAICIDQTDPADKSIQVSGMDQIYRGAERVLVWLGMDLAPAGSIIEEGSGSGDQSMVSSPRATYLGSCFRRIPGLVQDVETYLEMRHHEDQIIQKGKTTTEDQTTRSAAMAANIALASDPIWNDLERLRFNAYFSRLWIIQEVTLARNAVLLYGRNSLPWSMYAQLTSLCENIITSKVHDTKLVNRLYFAYNSRVSALTKLQGQISQVSNSLAGFDVDEENVLLMKLVIHNIRMSKASVPLDRVFSIMGLLDPAVKNSVQVDYSFEVLDQYWTKWIEFVRTILQYVPKALEDILSLATVLNRHPHLPSWCPDLADSSERRGIVGPVPAYAGMPGGLDWMTPADSQTFTFISNISHLRLHGLKVDEITHVVDLSWIKDKLQWARIFVDNDIDIDSDVAKNILVTIWKLMDHMREAGIVMADGDTIVARCLVANAYDNQAIASPQLLKDYLAFLRYLEHYTWGAATSSPLKKQIKTAALRFGDRFQRMARNRALFLTKSGRCGLGSCNSRQGDVLCVVMNCRVPYVLRDRADGLFRFVGEAYVDTLMHGEAFLHHDLNQDHPEEFIIH